MLRAWETRENYRFLAVRINIKRKYAGPDVRRIIILNGIKRIRGNEMDPSHSE